MNSVDAKKVLIACRPGTDDMQDAAVRAALEQVERDPELRQWWEEQQRFQHGIRECFRRVPVPGSLRDRILARPKIVSLPWWRRPVTLSAAAAMALLITFFAVRSRPSAENSFAVFRERMIGNVLRQYTMTIHTNHMGAIRRHLDEAQAPSDYVLAGNLARLPAIGAGVLSWKDKHVSMVCFQSPQQGTLFLFVVEAASVPGSPPQRDYSVVNTMATVSWTEDGKTYVLASHGSLEGLRSLP